MITISCIFLPHIRALAVIIFKSVGYIRQILTQLSINGHKQKAKKERVVVIQRFCSQSIWCNQN
ncbi:hypothetical protein [Symbiopectobacterium sp. RP]|uniref:hypothetical protein n=1 Tax=Symbiopectobacterium sp. RP TaxID=3248553 RepID=UPI003D2A6FDC